MEQSCLSASSAERSPPTRSETMKNPSSQHPNSYKNNTSVAPNDIGGIPSIDEIQGTISTFVS